MEDKIKLIEELCGGNSLAHVLEKLSQKRNAAHIFYGVFEIKFSHGFKIEWQLLKDNQGKKEEAKLQDQSEETILQIFKLLSGE